MGDRRRNLGRQQSHIPLHARISPIFQYIIKLQLVKYELRNKRQMLRFQGETRILAASWAAISPRNTGLGLDSLYGAYAFCPWLKRTREYAKRTSSYRAYGSRYERN